MYVTLLEYLVSLDKMLMYLYTCSVNENKARYINRNITIS